MTDNIERAIGRVEGRLGSFESKIDCMITAMVASERKSEESRDAQNERLMHIEFQNQKMQTDMTSAIIRIDSMEPTVADITRMRTQGIAGAAVLTTLGGIFGTTLFVLKDKIWAFFGGS